MCGRFVSPDEAAVERAWHIGRRNWKTPFGKPRYNVAPTMRVIMLRRDAADPGDPEPTLTCAVLTRPGAGRAGEIHERMPVVLPDEVHARWLDPARIDAAEAAALIEEHAQTDFELVRVGRGINRTEEDSEKLIEPMEAGEGRAVRTAASRERALTRPLRAARARPRLASAPAGARPPGARGAPERAR